MASPDDIREVLGLDRPVGAAWWWRVLLVLLVPLLAAAGWAVSAGPRADASSGYVTEAVQRGALTVKVIATGTIQPTNQVDVSSELSGMLRKVHVDHNDAVTAGQVLAELDTDKLTATVEHAVAALAAARAGVAEARATVAEKQAEYHRKQRLAAERFSSQQDLESARAAHERAQAALAQAEAQVALAEAQLRIDRTNLAKAGIRSPISGVILQRNASIGQTVASSFQAPVLFSIAEDLRQMELQVDIDEADIGKLGEGLAASFTVEAHPERSFPATIRQVRYAAQTTSGVVTYKAVLAIDNAELLLRPGMTATAEIVVEQVKDALLVANAALRFSPPAEDAPAKTSLLQSLLPRMPSFRQPSRPQDAKGSRAVWVLRDGAPAAVPVSTGATDGMRTRLLGGELTEGQAVIVDRAATRK